MTFGPFVVLGVFVAVILVGLACGGWYAAQTIRGYAGVSASAPTVDAYRSEVASITKPFFAQTLTMTEADVAAAGADLHSLAAKTQERVLRVRVPGSERQVHLGLVLLLEQWKRASSDGGNPAGVLEKTRAFVAATPWIAP